MIDSTRPQDDGQAQEEQKARERFGSLLQKTSMFGGLLPCSVRYQSEGDMVVLADSNGCLLDRESYLAIITGLQRMYDCTSEQDISEFNERHRLEYEDYMQELQERRRPATTKKQQKPESGYIYVISGGGYCKIGRAKDPDSRIKDIGAKLPFPIRRLLTIHVHDYKTVEREVHEHFTEKRAEGEWFTLTPADIEHIKGLADE